MSRDLRGALHDWAEHERRAADERTTDTRAVTAGLSRRVARRRAVRTGSTIAAAVVLVGGVAVGVQALDRREPVPPAEPTPTPAPTVTVSPTPEPTPTRTTPPVTSTSVLDALPLPDGIFTTTDDTWQLVDYQAWDENGSVLAEPSGLYLVAPDGPVYAVPAPEGVGTLLDWLPGTSTAVAWTDEGASLVDLLTGAVGPTFNTGVTTAVFAGDGSTDVWTTDASRPDVLERVRADGVTVGVVTGEGLSSDAPTWRLNPGRTVAVMLSSTSGRAVDLASLADVAISLPYPSTPAACAVVTWVDDERVLLECSAGGATALGPQSERELWLVPVGDAEAGAERLVGFPSTTSVHGVWQVADRLVAVSLEDGRLGSVDWWQATTSGATRLGTTDLAGLTTVAVRDDRLVVAEPSWMFGDESPWRLLAVDPTTGAAEELLTGVVAPGGASTTVFPRGFQPAYPMYGD
jgi:hypothetical protein